MRVVRIANCVEKRFGYDLNEYKTDFDTTEVTRVKTLSVLVFIYYPNEPSFGLFVYVFKIKNVARFLNRFSLCNNVFRSSIATEYLITSKT